MAKLNTLAVVFLSLWAAGTVGAQVTLPQKVNQAEFFVDTDPGSGGGTQLTAVDGTLDEIMEDVTAAVAASYSLGTHTLFVRVRNSTGTWGNTYAKPFVVTTSGAYTVPVPAKLTQAEFFVDTDLGPGGGTAMTAVDGTIDEIMEDLAGTLPSGSLSLGAHTLYVRVRNQDGTWGNVYAKPIFVSTSTAYTIALPAKVTNAEYFVDTDPGTGNGFVASVADGTADEMIEDITASFAGGSYSLGWHTLYVRVRNQSGTWGNTYAKPFLVSVAGTDFVTLPKKIVSGEFFVDTDPGVGNGTAMTANDGTMDEIMEDLTGNLSTGSYSMGYHQLFVRLQNSDGTWGNVFTKPFIVSDATAYAVQLPAKLTQAEYFIDNDPGAGVATVLGAADGTFNKTYEQALDSFATSGLSEGVHTVGVRFRKSDGTWSPAFISIFEIQNTTAPAKPTGLQAIAGNNQVILTWNSNDELDLNHYIIYKNLSSGFTPSPSDSIGLALATDSLFTDLSAVNGITYYYKIAAVDNGQLLSVVSDQVSATPSPANHAPVVVAPFNDMVVTAGMDTLLDSLTMHFADSDADTLLFGASTSDGGLIAATIVSGRLQLSPLAAVSGNADIYVTATDDSGASVIDTFNVIVNQQPAVLQPISDLTLNQNFGKAFVAVLTGVFSDPESGVLSFLADTIVGGVIPLISNDTLYLNSVSNFSGTAAVRVEATDPYGSSQTDEFVVTVNPVVNNRPIAVADNATTTFQTAVTIHVLNNDTDPDGDALTIQSVANGANGSAVKNSGDTTITYTPNNGFSGNDQLSYIVTDGNGGLDTAVVSVTVSAPIALTLTTSVLQNPALSKYADIYVVADTTLQNAPVVKRIIGGDSATVAMSGSGSIYRGAIEFTQSGSYTIRTHATSVTGSDIVQIRSFNATLARPGLTAQLKSLSEQSMLVIPKSAVKIETYFTAFEKEQAGEHVFEFGPSGSWPQALELTIAYDPASLKNPGKLFIYSFTGGEWKPLRTQVFQHEHLAKTRVTELGLFKLMENEQFDGTNIVPSTFALKQNYPNPFNPTTTIVYDVANDETVELSVYNMLGQKVKTLANGFQLAGQYRVFWDGTNLNGQSVASGVYFYRIKSPSFVKTKKMLLIR